MKQHTTGRWNLKNDKTRKFIIGKKVDFYLVAKWTMFSGAGQGVSETFRSKKKMELITLLCEIERVFTQLWMKNYINKYMDATQ